MLFHLSCLISQIRKMPAGQAANMAVHSAIKKNGLADDITVIVVGEYHWHRHWLGTVTPTPVALVAPQRNHKCFLYGTCSTCI